MGNALEAGRSGMRTTLSWLNTSVIALVCSLYLSSSIAGDFAMARKKMVGEIEADVRQTSLYLDKKALDPRVMEAIGEVPRHDFVPDDEVWAFLVDRSDPPRDRLASLARRVRRW